MALLVHWYVVAPGAPAANLPGLVSAVALGVLCYLGLATMLWLVVGRPHGAEATVFSSVNRWMETRRA
ncbi:MAG: hypothetical protein M5U08_21535 [Burkholderiales bacterium]|nr:hypothetical protein [Burkholderiales bacterium]